MPFRSVNPATIICEQCGVKKTIKSVNPSRDGAFCSAKCSVAWHRERDAQTTWLLMELTRLLWESRPQDFRFEPGVYPGWQPWRRELIAMGKWIREIVDASIR